MIRSHVEVQGTAFRRRGEMQKHVLVVDDDPNLCALVAADLRERGYRATVTPSAEVVPALLESDDVDAVLMDIRMPDAFGINLCACVVQSRRDVPLLVMTAFGSMGSFVAAIRAGAYDYFTKPLDLAEVAAALDRAFAERALRIEARRLRAEIAEASRAGRTSIHSAS
jgi:DNA-binding NtrC family response regulator